jgi:hypothetical protein
MTAPPNVYRCRACASTSYARLTQRGPDGVMRYSGQYRCSGCSFTFSEPSMWRERRMRPRVPNDESLGPLTARARDSAAASGGEVAGAGRIAFGLR